MLTRYNRSGENTCVCLVTLTSARCDEEQETLSCVDLGTSTRQGLPSQEVE